jgi:DNA-binding transcriptional LysR family regulator
MIDSRQLRVFMVLVRHLNMSRAAEELKLTSSAVSHCVKALEADLGCRLFERSSRRVALSEAGLRLAGEAAAILRRMEAARARLHVAAARQSTRLRLGASDTVCQHVMPPVLREFRESFPDHAIEIAMVNTAGAEKLLAENRIDLAIVIKPQRPGRMEFMEIAGDRLVFLLNPLHPWASRNKIERSEMAAQRLILPGRRSETFRLIEAYFLREGMPLRPFIEIDSDEAIKQFARLDLGIGICPAWMAAQEIEQGLLRSFPLGRRKIVRTWGILTRRKHQLDFAQNLLVGMCRDVAKNVMKSPL